MVRVGIVREFEGYARSFIERALHGAPGELVGDVYVVSLCVEDEEDDPRRPTVMVGFNTETRVVRCTPRPDQDPGWPIASNAQEARWNFAFWCQNDLGTLCDSERDALGVELREAWIRQLGCWYSDEDEARDFERAMHRGAQITDEFVRLLVRAVRDLHVCGVVQRVFGRPVPVLIHELEYYQQIADQNREANPGGLAEDFARWIESR